MSRRRRRSARRSKTLTLSSNDADWAVLREKAARRRLSISRYVEMLVLGSDWEVRDGPALALAKREQREMLQTVRELRSLLGDRPEAPSFIEDLQTRIALLFDEWAISMVDSGRREALRALLVTRLGPENAERVVERTVALAEAPARMEETDARPGPDPPRERGSRF